MSPQDRQMAALARNPGSGCLYPAWPASLSMHWPRLKGHRGVNVELERPSARMRDLVSRQVIEAADRLKTCSPPNIGNAARPRRPVRLLQPPPDFDSVPR